MPPASSGQDALPVYKAEPPPWLMPSHREFDLGYHGFHPPHPKQEEEILSETNVKTGYSVPAIVGAEVFSQHGGIQTRLASESALVDLADLMNEVLARRAENQRIPEHTFKLPQRITMNESRKQTWMTEFYNSEVSLDTIAEKIPHETRGHDLLIQLHDHKVAVARAVWYVRSLGGNENQGMRNRPNHNPTQYSIEWANIMTSYLKKQLTEIALPSATRLGMNIKQTFRGVLNHPETRDKWVSKFSYCLDLLREFYAEGLVDRSTFLNWLAQQFAASTLAQATFVARMVDEYLEAMLPYRSLLRACLDGCLSKYSEVESSIGAQHLSILTESLTSIVQRIFVETSDPFVNPPFWMAYGGTVKQIISDTPTSMDPNSVDEILELGLRDRLEDVTQRNEALAFLTLPDRGPASAKFAMNDLKLLNSIDETTDIFTVKLLELPFKDTDMFKKNLHMMITWSITPHQYGDHRPWVVSTLLQRWRVSAEEHAQQRGFPDPSELIQDYLFDWLDNSDLVLDPANTSATSITFGEFVKFGLFSYSKYFQRLIARAETGLQLDQEPASRHRALVKSIPLCVPTASLVNQRKVALYGINARGASEDALEREMRRALRSCLPELFGAPPLPLDDELPIDISVLINASRYEQVRVVRHWLWPIMEKYIQRTTTEAVLDLQTYSTFTYILHGIKFYVTMLDSSLELLARVGNPELLHALVDTFRRHGDVWAAMGAHERLLGAMCAAHAAWNWETRRAQCRPLLCLLIEYHSNPHMPEENRRSVQNDAAALMQSLFPPNKVSSTDDTLGLLPTLLYQEVPDLATLIWMQYGHSAHWIRDVWDEVVETIHSGSMAESNDANDVDISRLSSLLWDIDQHLRPKALDEHLLDWLSETRLNEFKERPRRFWAAMTSIFLELVIRDTFSASTIMKGFFCPIWRLCAADTSSSCSTMLRAANRIASDLLLCNLAQSPTFRQVDLVQRLQTRRRAIYQQDEFSVLVACLPKLVVMEQSSELREEDRDSCSQLRLTLSRHPEFRMVAYRNLDLVSKAFQDGDCDTFPYAMEQKLGEALQQILSDSKPWDLRNNGLNFPTLSRGVSPWRYSRTAIEVQLALRALGAGLKDAKTSTAAADELHKFSASFFGGPRSSEETDLIADMLRGISGVAAANLINRGLDRVTQLIGGQYEFTDSAMEPLLHDTGETLYLMSSILQPQRVTGTALPALEPTVQDGFVKAIHTILTNVIELPSDVSLEPFVTDLVAIAARLWQFDLGLPGVWTPKARSLADDALDVLVRLAVRYSCSVEQNDVIFDVILDTVFMLFDEAPRDTKMTIIDLFHRALDPDTYQLPVEMPMAHCRRLQSIFAYAPQDAYVRNLVHARRDSCTGKLSFGSGVESNPWEWSNNIQVPPSTGYSRSRPELLNSSSIPLERFGVQATGDRVVGELPSARAVAAVHTWNDGLGADSVFERDWRDTRVSWPSQLSPRESEDGGASGAGSQDATGKDANQRFTTSASPAGGPFRASPVFSLKSGSGSAGTGAGTKRKASTSTGASLETLELDAPTPRPTRGGKRARGKTTTASTRAKSRKK